MSRRYDILDLAGMTLPPVVESVDYDALTTAIGASYVASMATEGVVVPPPPSTDPAGKLVQVGAYREAVMRERVNDAALAVMLPWASGGDLDAIATNLLTRRLPGESDDQLRLRASLAPEIASTAGPIGAYDYLARSVSPDILSVAPSSPEPLDILVVLQLRDGLTDAEIDRIRTDVMLRLSPDDVRPMCDQVTVVIGRTIWTDLHLRPRILSGPAGAAQLAAVKTLAASRTAPSRWPLGRDLDRSALVGECWVDGLLGMRVDQPVNDIVCSAVEQIRFSTVTITPIYVEEP